MAADGARRVALDGRLDQTNAAARLAESEEWFRGGEALVVDLASVERADSAGVALLVAWRRRAAAAGMALWLTNMPAAIRSIVDVCGLTSFLAADEKAPPPVDK